MATSESIARTIESVAPMFDELDLNVGAADLDDYRRWKGAGASGVVCFQETYDPAAYGYVHPAGPKTDFMFRFEAPERAAMSGISRFRLGVLLGLASCARPALADVPPLHERFLERGVVVEFR